MDQDMCNSCAISVVHHDILQTHILTRLDGTTLAAASSVSSELRVLSSDESLWRGICNRAWPSTVNPRVRDIITSFPSGYRSFYADCHSTVHLHRLSPPLSHHAKLSSTLISTVDIHYKKKNHLLSKAIETDTAPGSWTGSPFQVKLLSAGQHLTIPGKLDFQDVMCESEMEKNITLSWIIIDPDQKRAVNVTSGRPVRVHRDWSTMNVEVRFGTILCGEVKRGMVECAVVVTCGGTDNEDLHVKQVRLEIEDMKGNKLGWKESLVILQEAMENGERKRVSERGVYEKFSEMKERSERKSRRAKRWEDFAIWIGAAIVGFSGFFVVEFFINLDHHVPPNFQWLVSNKHCVYGF